MFGTVYRADEMLVLVRTGYTVGLFENPQFGGTIQKDTCSLLLNGTIVHCAVKVAFAIGYELSVGILYGRG